MIGNLRRESVRNLFLVGLGGAGRGLLGDPVRLVGGDQIDPPLRAPVEVHAGDQVIGVVVLDEPGDEVQQTAYRVHRGAVRSLDRFRYPEIGAEVEGGGIEEHQASSHIPHDAVCPIRHTDVS